MRVNARYINVALASITGAVLAVGGCADSGGPEVTYDGPAVAIDVAALNLQGVGDVVWDIQVENVNDDVVWQRRITSSSYGDSAGSAAYVGPCDADTSVQDNTVKVWVVGVYTADITTANAGAFASGDASGVTGTTVPFQNPTTPSTPLSQDFTCVENVDVAVQFDVALMRPAQQGFFDIAVNFNNIFCSAKFDCAYEGPTADPSDDTEIQLLHQPGGGRGRTAVLGFACTAGIGSVTTELVMSDIDYECDDGSFAYLIPDADGNIDVSLEDVSTPAPLFAAAVSRGNELLTSGGQNVNKVYWNVMLGYSDMDPDDDAGGAVDATCWLKAQATALDASDENADDDPPTTPSGVTYPVVMWSIQVTDDDGNRACSQHPLDLSTTIDLTTFTPYADEVVGAFYANEATGYAPGFGWYPYPAP